MAPVERALVELDNIQLAVRTRRSKGKSMSGCLGCKRRRVKCDEIQPICSRCKTNNRSCVYETKRKPKWKTDIGVLVLSPVAAKASLPPEINIIKSVPKEPFRLFENFHMPQFRLSTMPTTDLHSFRTEDSRLLAHFISNTSRGLVGSQELWIEQTLKLAIQNNFLMHAILTISARHLQHLSGSSDLRSVEIQHHQRTLSTYQSALQCNMIRMNQDAVLGTSLILCFYSSSLLDFDPSSSFPVADSCLSYYPGIRSIVSDAPEIAHNGLFRSIVTPPLVLRKLHPEAGPGAKLLNLLNSSAESAFFGSNKSFYIERIESLTLYMSTSTMQGLEAGALKELLLCFLRWQSFCPPQFIALVRAFDPVSIILLAHYYAAAGFVHSRAGNMFWWWQEKPAYMVRTISEYLSPRWDIWLEWPNSIIARCRDGPTPKLTKIDACTPWSSAVGPIDGSFFPDWYDWDRLKAFSGSAVVNTSDAECA